jgi:hypothetical protein
VTRTGCALAMGLLTCASGCFFTATGTMWMPTLESRQQSGVGDRVDAPEDLGVSIGPALLAFEVLGQEGGQRLRVDYWKMEGTGTATTAGLNFASETFTGVTNTAIQFESIGLLWEPGIQRGNVRLAMVLGFDFIQFHMNVVDESSNEADILFPASDWELANMGVYHVPVPLLGLGVEVGLKEWLLLVCRAEMYDSSIIELVPEVGAQFGRADIGVAFGKPTTRGLKGFVGYRYFHAEFQYQTDVGDTTLSGLMASLSVRF